MKTTVVVFTENNARIITLKDATPEQLEPYRSMPNAVINPDRSAVKDLPPHLWKLNSIGNIVPMTEEEQKARQVNLSVQGAKNIIQLPGRIINQVKFIEINKKVKPILFVLERLAYVALGALITFLVSKGGL